MTKPKPKKTKKTSQPEYKTEQQTIDTAIKAINNLSPEGLVAVLRAVVIKYRGDVAVTLWELWKAPNTDNPESVWDIAANGLENTADDVEKRLKGNK